MTATTAPSSKRLALRASRAETGFYSQYTWCLDPYPTTGALLDIIAGELARRTDLEDWKAEEAVHNLYLSLCGIYTTACDFLASRSLRLPGTGRKGRMGQGLRMGENLLNAPVEAMRARGKHRVGKVLHTLETCMDCVADAILHQATLADANLGDHDRPLSFRRLVTHTIDLLRREAPRELLDARMQMPEAFRCQDLSLEDGAAMADELLKALSGPARRLLFLGVRTAGAYLGPLAAASLRRAGYGHVAWMTVRPKERPSAWEEKRLRALLGGEPLVVIVDDHPNTGRTLQLMLDGLRRRQVKDRDLVVLVPQHPARLAWDLPEERRRGVRIVQLAESGRHKRRLLESSWTLDTVRRYVAELGYGDVHCYFSEETEGLNRSLASQYRHGFEVRLKRVVDVEATAGGKRLRFRVIAKSVGWGWLSYHAFLISSRLQGDVPPLLGLRKGFLFEQWVPGRIPEANENTAAWVGRYIARRANALRLERDPSFYELGRRWSVWKDLTSWLRQVYGTAGSLKAGAILGRLAREAGSRPALVDGSLRPQDCVLSESGLVKVDFEHHNFGGGELDLADPAYDIAVALFEFQFDARCERILLEAYRNSSQDPDVEKRLPVFQLIHGLNARKATSFWFENGFRRAMTAESTRRFFAACQSLTNCVAAHLSRSMSGSEPVLWTDRVFHLDIDGVLDWNHMGFTHTTRCGVQALDLLRQGGVSVVLNTARSLKAVQDYCRIFHLPGGFAELGSVFWDAVSGKAIPLADARATAELETLRRRLEGEPGIVLDPFCRYSVRCFEVRGGKLGPVRADRMQQVLEHAGLTRLTVRNIGGCTWVGSRDANKGTAVGRLPSLVPIAIAQTYAMGDGKIDSGMLQAADVAYAPANACEAVRDLVARQRCRRTRSALQKGLLEAALEITGTPPRDVNAFAESRQEGDQVLDQLLAVADHSRLRAWGLLLRPGAIL